METNSFIRDIVSKARRLMRPAMPMTPRDALRILATLVSLGTFLVIAVWAYARRNRDRFDEAAAIPFQQD